MSPEEPPVSNLAETYLLPSTADPGSKEENDVAFASELLNCGLLSERQLTSLFADWSIYGHVPLDEHVKSAGVLSDAQLQELKQNAAQTLAETAGGAADETQRGASTNSQVASSLMRFDASGRLAKLLGVSSSASAGTSEKRQSHTRYRLIRKLGQGGLGTVWLARDTQLKRLVALKEISNVQQTSDAAAERFRQEAEITGRLEHPGIVPVYQLGEDAATGRAFYTMRFLGKSTLQDAIAEYHERREEGDDDPMLLRHLLAAFVNVCNAVAHAHSRKVIHRDLKPENVVIDNYGQVIVIDWGLAKVLDDAVVEQLAAGALMGDGRTAEGQVLGTPLYMAPEQAAGRVDEVDQRTDIYGLGAILFAVITGYAPHERSQSQSIDARTGARGMISTIASGPTPHPAETHPQVDDALAAICAKAMARRRYARYQSASELAEEVQRWMAGEPVAAFRETMWQQTRRWIGRHQRVSQLIAAGLAILLATGVTMSVAARHEQLAARQSRFDRMNGDVNEIEMQLRSTAANLIRNTRFMASLPPVQGIINARSGNGLEGEDDQIWLERLATIFNGLLRANPDYLAVSYVAKSNSAPSGDDVSHRSQEIVRVERNANDRSYVRTVPASRLAEVEDDPVLAEVIRLEPGDVRLTMADERPQDRDLGDVERLLAGVPIYDDMTGAPFGMVLIETDLIGQLDAVLQGVVDLMGEVYICDGEGKVMAAQISGDVEKENQFVTSITDVIPEVTPIFAPERFSSKKTDGETYVARRFRVDPTSKGVAIVARLHAD